MGKWTWVSCYTVLGFTPGSQQGCHSSVTQHCNLLLYTSYLKKTLINSITYFRGQHAPGYCVITWTQLDVGLYTVLFVLLGFKHIAIGYNCCGQVVHIFSCTWLSQEYIFLEHRKLLQPWIQREGYVLYRGTPANRYNSVLAIIPEITLYKRQCLGIKPVRLSDFCTPWAAFLVL